MQTYVRQQTADLVRRLADRVSRAAKKIRERLRDLMHAAGAVRDLDIAIDLVREAGVEAQSHLLARLRDDRREASRQLLYQIRLWKNRGFSKKWRTNLHLNA